MVELPNGLDGQIVKLLDSFHIHVHIDVVFEGPYLGGAPWHDEVLIAERGEHIIRRESLSL